jgi:hypothetical protein
VVNVPTQPLFPHKKMTIPVKINVWGRSGVFTNQMKIKTNSDDSPFYLDITGNIVTDIWYNGQAIRCSGEKNQKQTTTFFEIHTIDYPDITFDLNSVGDNLTVRELTREKLEKETIIRFSLEIDNLDNNEFINRELILKPIEPFVAPISIPVYYYCVEENPSTVSL